MLGRYTCLVYIDQEPDSHKAEFSLQGQSLALQLPDERVDLPFSSLRAERGGFDRHMLVLRGQKLGRSYALFVQHEIPEVLKAMRASRPPQPLEADLARHFAPTRTLRWVLLGLALTALLGLGVYYLGAWAFRSAIDAAVANVPVEWELELGRYSAQEVLSQKEICSDKNMVEGVQEIVQRLNDAVPDSPYPFTVKVVHTAEVNAFALPGGYIFVNSGLLDKARSPEEVAGVLAHEMQHALKRHGIRNLMGRASIGLLVGLLFGDVQGLGGFAVGAASELAALSFSREQEVEADLAGLELLFAAGIDPNGMPAFFEVLTQEESQHSIEIPSFLSTHPETLERIAALQDAIAQHGSSPTRPFVSNWETTKSTCTPVPWADPDKPVEPKTSAPSPEPAK